jgi:hypothetical protein
MVTHLIFPSQPTHILSTKIVQLIHLLVPFYQLLAYTEVIKDLNTRMSLEMLHLTM